MCWGVLHTEILVTIHGVYIVLHMLNIFFCFIHFLKRYINQFHKQIFSKRRGYFIKVYHHIVYILAWWFRVVLRQLVDCVTAMFVSLFGGLIDDTMAFTLWVKKDWFQLEYFVNCRFIYNYTVEFRYGKHRKKWVLLLLNRR